MFIILDELLNSVQLIASLLRIFNDFDRGLWFLSLFFAWPQLQKFLVQFLALRFFEPLVISCHLNDVIEAVAHREQGIIV